MSHDFIDLATVLIGLRWLYENRPLQFAFLLHYLESDPSITMKLILDVLVNVRNNIILNNLSDDVRQLESQVSREIQRVARLFDK